MADYTPRIKEHYLKSILPEWVKTHEVNPHQVPRLNKIVVNVGAGKIAVADAKNLEYIIDSLAKITGQHPVKTRSRVAIAGFKLRASQPIGAMVTLRGERMYEFLDRLIAVTLPRVRDFRGLSRTAFSGGSYSIGLNDHTVFPEILFESGRTPFSLQVTLVTSAKTADGARELLEQLGVPFKKENVK